MPEFIHGSETRALLGACFEVYREKECGFLEAVLQVSRAGINRSKYSVSGSTGPIAAIQGTALKIGGFTPA